VGRISDIIEKQDSEFVEAWDEYFGAKNAPTGESSVGVTEFTGKISMRISVSKDCWPANHLVKISLPSKSGQQPDNPA
jgi:hypothetical protein